MWVYGLVLVVHLLLCFVLIGVILLQGGRGGLSEALGGGPPSRCSAEAPRPS